MGRRGYPAEFRRKVLHPEGEVIAAVVEGGGVDLVDPDTFEVTGSLF